MIFSNLLKSIGIGGSNEFPRLTIKTLMTLRQKVNDEKATVDDCELINHYLGSIGMEGYLEQRLRDEEGVLSFDEIEDVYDFEDPDDPDDLTAAGVSILLLDCIRILRQRVYRGEQIY